MHILILKTIQESWLYVNPLAIMALNEEFEGTTITLNTEIPDSNGKKSRHFTVEEDLETLMRLIHIASS
ncbi:hypothetical protein PVA45_00845 [Entomospira entomophila]|uniref:Uncharacterized protein n=1 Tax=Entomospira entomophila TaxID=2719988 RepID=A0A968KS81_9SPIO|nr:hypothetical protein [Entomospira entomophilus]NIZ40067.1 hypothetical protein [Entomospira entomophilus]WDI35628.1 hypothetical protein PVA45_00845 [Entomospira entomophilus]